MARKKVTSERLLYPGYVIVQMFMENNGCGIYKGEPRVTGLSAAVVKALVALQLNKS